MAPRIPFYARSTQTVRLLDLLTSLRDGNLRVPRFERGFKWSDRRRVDLLDSVYREYPIGAILVWRAARTKLATLPGIADLPVDADPDGSTDYLLDGLQRLTTIFGALGGALYQERREVNAGHRNLLDSTNPSDARWRVAGARIPWEIVFDIDSLTFSQIPADGAVPPRTVPLSILLDSFQLQEFRRAADFDKDRVVARRIDELQAKIRDYMVPVIPLLHEKLEDAIESFRRLNRQGTRMQEADLLRALSWTPSFDLSQRLSPIRKRVEALGWGSLSEDVLVDVCKLEVGLAPYSYAPEKFGRLVRETPGLFEQVEERVVNAIGFLGDECGVRGVATLPYGFQLVLLAQALPLDRAARDAVGSRARDWFWKTTWTHYFASQRRISQALKNLKALLRGEAVARLLDDDAVEAAGRFDPRRARDKALSLLLARRLPEADQMLTRLAQSKMAVLQPLVPELRLRDLAAGNVVAADPHELAALREQLQARSTNVDAPLRRAHFITEDALERLWTGDVLGFARARLQRIRRAERMEVEGLGLRYVELSPDRDGEVDGDGPLFARDDDPEEP